MVEVWSSWCHELPYWYCYLHRYFQSNLWWMLMQWEVASKRRKTYWLLLLVQSGKQPKASGHSSCHVFLCTISSFPLLRSVWTNIMPLSVCVFLNQIMSSTELFSSLRESIMYRTHFLDFNTSTVSHAFFENYSQKIPPPHHLVQLLLNPPAYVHASASHLPSLACL